MVRKTISDDEISIDDFLGSRRRSNVAKKPVGDFNIDDFIEPVRRSKVIKEVADDAILDDAERSDKSADKDIISSDEVTNILPQESATTASNVST